MIFLRSREGNYFFLFREQLWQNFIKSCGTRYRYLKNIEVHKKETISPHQLFKLEKYCLIFKMLLEYPWYLCGRNLCIFPHTGWKHKKNLLQKICVFFHLCGFRIHSIVTPALYRKYKIPFMTHFYRPQSDTVQWHCFHFHFLSLVVLHIFIFQSRSHQTTSSLFHFLLPLLS